jgi:hypothetical protein
VDAARVMALGVVEANVAGAARAAEGARSNAAGEVCWG